MVRNYKIPIIAKGYDETIRLPQYDTGYSLVFEMTHIPNGATLTGLTVTLEGVRADKLKYEYTGTISGSTVTIPITTAMTACAGLGEAHLVFSQGNMVYATINLHVYIDQSPVPDDAIDADVETARTIQQEVQAIVDGAAATVEASLGTLSNLTTTDKSSAVGAINEVVSDVTQLNAEITANINSVKSDLGENGIVEIGAITSKTAITTNVSVGTVVNLTPSTENSTDTTIINCESGDIFSISGTGWNSERLWAFVDADNKLLSKSSANETQENYMLTAPIGANKIVCNFRNSLGTYYGVARFRNAVLPFHADGQNITSSTGATICGNDLDSLPRNTIYGLVPYSGLANMPYADTGTGNGGLIFTLSKESADNATMTQFIVRRNGRIYVRQYWNNWQEWSEYYSIADISTVINDALSPLSSTISDLQNKTGFYPTGQNLTSGTVAEICSGDANNLPNNNIYGISVAYDAITNMPFEPRGVNGSYVGTIYTLGKETARGYGDVQYYVPKANRCSSYVRSYTGSSWSAWKPIGEKAWTQVLGIGDSICEGWRNDNRGFAGILGVPFRNLGITGATLGAKENHTQIYTEIESIDITEDLVIAEGGINDYYSSVPLGDMPTRPVINDTQAEAIDKTTTSGGLAYLLYLIIKKAPFAQRYFLITHKTKNYPYTKNVSDGYTQQELHDRIVAICKLYNFKIIDVYEDSVINSEFDVYKSPTAYSDSNTEITKQYYVDKDGIHPLALGYQAGYLPVMIRTLERANML